jgi:hypothetical protein
MNFSSITYPKRESLSSREPTLREEDACSRSVPMHKKAVPPEAVETTASSSANGSSEDGDRDEKRSGRGKKRRFNSRTLKDYQQSEQLSACGSFWSDAPTSLSSTGERIIPGTTSASQSLHVAPAPARLGSNFAFQAWTPPVESVSFDTKTSPSPFLCYQLPIRKRSKLGPLSVEPLFGDEATSIFASPSCDSGSDADDCNSDYTEESSDSEMKILENLVQRTTSLLKDAVANRSSNSFGKLLSHHQDL